MDMMENPSESVIPPSQDTDYAQGYEIRIRVKPDGFTVDGPLPLPQSAGNESEESEDEEGGIPDLPTALKHVIAITKEHPLDTDLNGHFEAGYSGE